MGKKKNKPHLDINTVLQILAQRANAAPGSKRHKPGPNPKGKAKHWRNRGDPNFNHDPYFDGPELEFFSSRRKLGGRSKHGSTGDRGKLKGSGTPRINFIPSSKNRVDSNPENPEKGEFNGDQGVSRWKLLALRNLRRELFTQPRDNTEESDGPNALIAGKASFEEGIDSVVEEERVEDTNPSSPDCEDEVFRIDTTGDPSLVGLPTRQDVEPNFIVLNGMAGVNDSQTREAHYQEALQDYADNLSVDDMNHKFNEVCLEEETDPVVDMPCGNSALGSERGEEWAQGFKEGLGCAFIFLPKSAKKILTKELKNHIDKSLWPDSICPTPKGKPNQPQFGPDKKPKEDRRHSVTIKGSCLFSANDAINEMLSNPHRKQLQFPLIDRPHRRKVIALANLYCLEVIMPRVCWQPIRVLKPESGFGLPDAAKVEALIGRRLESPPSRALLQKQPRALPAANSSAPPIDPTNVGHRLLSQMGWAPGQALGANGGGIVDPIQAEIRRKRQGLGS
ncbi:G patch domain-containing protein 2 [Massospora cicadina]|nr:G patch domain-containing protein 2 [Massospora cicadina]